MKYADLRAEIERLDNICDEIISSFDKEWFSPERIERENLSSMDMSRLFDEYSKKRNEACQPHLEKLSELKRMERFTKPYTLSELPDYGDIMSVDNFIENVKCDGFIDYDGFGRYVKDGKETNVDVFPSDVKNKLIRTEFDTIIWFNR